MIMGHSAIPMNKERVGFSPSQLPVIANDMSSIVNVHFQHTSRNNRMYTVLSRGYKNYND